MQEVEAIAHMDSEHGQHGQDTHSSIQHSDAHGQHQNSELDHNGSEIDNEFDGAPISSRGSTKATGEEDTMSLASRIPRPFVGRNMWDNDDEEEKDENGQKVLTNKFLREMIKKEPRKYYRTAHLNDKLYLHYKGFPYIKNLEQFTELKCLYFEGNGLRSLRGLEQNIELRSLYVQENCIEVIEGLDSLKELRVLNLNENMIRKVTGLAGIERLETLYLKNNRLGQDRCGDVESLRGLLERPTITCLDLQSNYLRDPAILEEVIYKMPNLRVLYLMNNEVVK